MMRKRLALSHDATRGWHVDLPSYAMVPGTMQPVTAGLVFADGIYPSADTAKVMALIPSVEVECPAGYAETPGGPLNAALIRAMYKGHPIFGTPGWVPPKEFA